MKNQVNKEEKTYRGWFRVKQIKKIRKRKKVCLYCKGIECHKNKEENEKCKEEKLKKQLSKETSAGKKVTFEKEEETQTKEKRRNNVAPAEK